MRTAAESLQQHGFTGEQLLKLSRKAAEDALKRHGAFLDQERLEELSDYMLEVGVRYAARYENGHQISIATFLYRRMRIRYVDWLRLTRGDSRAASNKRHPPGGFVPLYEVDGSTPGSVVEDAVIARQTLRELVDERLSAA